MQKRWFGRDPTDNPTNGNTNYYLKANVYVKYVKYYPEVQGSKTAGVQ